MKRFLDNLFVDLLSAALMVGMAATGYILRFPLPPGTNKSLSLWGLTRHQWGAVHTWIGYGLAAAVVVHVVLHWQWIAISVKRRFLGTASPSKPSLVSGLATWAALAAVLTLFGWAAQTGVKTITEPIEGVCPPETSSPQTEPIASVDAQPAAEQRIDFWNDVYPIFEKSCLRCHGPSRQTSGFRVDRKEAFFTGTTPWVVPGHSESSPLIALISGDRKDMAQADAHRLTDAQVSVVRAWIDAGADWPKLLSE